MKKIFLTATIAILFLAQPCLGQVTTDTPAATQETTPATELKTAEDEIEKTETSAKAPVPVPVPFEANIAKLLPANSSINFIGRHVTKDGAPDPNQRLGGFSDFKGEVHLNDDGSSLKAIVLDFNTKSISTPIPDLTKHLLSPDFLNVEEFPTANFTSTEIVAGAEEGQYEITGDFTLMGKTQPITMPCNVAMTEEGIVIDSEFNLDRTQFGMDSNTEKVSNMVSIKMNVGMATATNDAEETQRRNPADRFKEMDADGDGKLVGDEIPERMQPWIDNIDTDGDGAVTMEEMETAMKKFRQNRGGGGNGGGDNN
jgi:polyisoprenoid-binding protein YceI